ncbi:MAG: tyrosine-type recombinase/integrase [Azoarcus sp.]|jgi:integrase|nr:tyrosine-type recombinase/integrase [Azoarcus sp.]
MSKKDMTMRKWRREYMRIVRLRNLAAATLDERAKCSKDLCRAIGPDRRLRKVRPVHVAQAMRAVWEAGQQSRAQRLLVVARDMFAEAVSAGALDKNPAMHVKPLPYHVRRARLSIRHWRRTQAVLAGERAKWRRLLAVLALVTGQRRSDLVKMRFADVWGGYLHVEQVKTGARIALPLDLKLRAIKMTLGDVIELCRAYEPPGETLLRKSTGAPVSVGMLSKAFTSAFALAVKRWRHPEHTTPSLAECRSLSERLYSSQGIDTQTLLGHKRPATTALYHDDRGLSRAEGRWRHLSLRRRRRRRRKAAK